MRATSLLIQVTAPRRASGGNQTSEGRSVLTEQHWDDLYVVALTGTFQKYESLEAIVRPEGVFVPGIIGLMQYAQAGRADEPQTSDCVTLMLGKRRNQETIFLRDLWSDPGLARRLKNVNLLRAGNDVNTLYGGVPLTKSRLQKEECLDKSKYQKLILASLKYLAMREEGERPTFDWAKLQANWDTVEQCAALDWNGRVFLPIEYQVVDMFDVAKLHARQGRIARLTRLSPTVAVIRKSYAALELDFTLGNGLIGEIVWRYLSDHWNEADFNPDRYPLGIRQRDLLSTFLHFGQHVLVSNNATGGNVVYARDHMREGDELGKKQVAEIMAQLEVMLNGFGADAYAVAEQYWNMPEKAGNLYTITMKPGANPMVTTMRLPAS